MTGTSPSMDYQETSSVSVWDSLNLDNISFDSLDQDMSHKVLPVEMEIGLVSVYVVIAVLGMFSNLALIAVILGENSYLYVFNLIPKFWYGYLV